MDYNPKKIERYWQNYWEAHNTFKADNHSARPKYYVLDMFPYPSGAGLHVGHPLGYIASDIYARYKRLQNFNVLHPIGYDSFGLPAEQYAIQTGQHPAVTTKTNIEGGVDKQGNEITGYENQMKRLGFSFDWDREVRTSSPEYYKWTQWIFIQLFDSYYDKNADKAVAISELAKLFETDGNREVSAETSFEGTFTAEEWKSYSAKEQSDILLQYRLTYLAEAEVNWCPELGTVLANDEVVNGVSERGGYPVVRKKMTQWMMRITAFAERLLSGLDTIDWPEPLKEQQRNWIGKSKGAEIEFEVLTPALSKGEGVVRAGNDDVENLTPTLSKGERAVGAGDDDVENLTPALSKGEGVVGAQNDDGNEDENYGYQTADPSLAPILFKYAKEMRKNATPAEKKLWEALRNRSLNDKFRRQHPIDKFIADFVCIPKKLIIEVDGGYHQEATQYEIDEQRSKLLEEQGYKVIRFTNDEVLNNTQAIISKIESELKERQSHVPLSFGEGLGVREVKEENKNKISHSTSKTSNQDEPTPVSNREGLGVRVFTTRPDTIFGVSFMTLAPEHPLVEKITTPEYKEKVQNYVEETAKKSERERMSEVDKISGQFTGAYAKHPFTHKPIPIWIGDYVLASYGSGAVMAVPAGDERDYKFAKHYDLPIPNIFDKDISEEAFTAKEGFTLINSDFLDGLGYQKATEEIINIIEERGLGKGKINYRLRDAVFSRQRYWGEPIPIYYKNGIPTPIPTEYLPLELPEVDEYLPTETGEPPLGRAENWAWNEKEHKVVSVKDIDEKNVFPLELNTMPGWAGSSWYWMRYMDPNDTEKFASREALDYWKEVDLYIGGSEHATGHLLYSRFWNKFLRDMNYAPTEEPFQKLINQGMILGNSTIIYNVYMNIGQVNINNSPGYEKLIEPKNLFVTNEFYDIYDRYKTLQYSNKIKENFDEYNDLEKRISKIKSFYYNEILKLNPNSKQLQSNGSLYFDVVLVPVRIDFSLIDESNNILDKEKFKKWLNGFYKDADFIDSEDGNFYVHREVEKMSKTKYNVLNPDEVADEYGADCLRMYEMFLGPIEQSKPWNTQGLSGVSSFLKKFWRLFFQNSILPNGTVEESSSIDISDAEPTAEELKILHQTIKKVQEDLESFSFNTSVSTFMIATNELTKLKCNKRAILEPLVILISPYAPHIAEELWRLMGHDESINFAEFPKWEQKYLVESTKEYPISFNGKMRFTMELPLDLSKEEAQKIILEDERTQKYLEGKPVKNFIYVPGKVINIVS